MVYPAGPSSSSVHATLARDLRFHMGVLLAARLAAPQQEEEA
jgi:hypothetical protein